MAYSFVFELPDQPDASSLQFPMFERQLFLLHCILYIKKQTFF